MLQTKGIKKISLEYNLELAFLCEEIEENHNNLHNAILSIESQGWKIITVDQNRGYAWELRKLITIPVFTFARNKKDKDYALYYLAHEVAHVIAGCENQHNAIL